MRYLFLLFLLFPAIALAQPADIPRLPVGGVYHIKAQMADDEDTTEICCVRADASPVEDLGCNPAGANEVVEFDVAMTATEGSDAAIRCYAKDVTGLVSDYSENAYLVDFTRPGVVVLLP